MEPLDLITPENLIGLAEEKGRSFKPIKTSQIRNFYSAIVSIKNKVQMMGNEFDVNTIKSELLLLKPKVAYAAGRQLKTIKPFKEFMDDVINSWMKATDKKKATTNFFNLIESMVAYHKFYGGE